MRGAGIALGVVLLALWCAGPAQAAPKWLDETKTFAPAEVETYAPSIAFGPNGHAAAAWVVSPQAGQSSVLVVTRPPGGDWSAPTELGRGTAGIERVQVEINGT